MADQIEELRELAERFRRLARVVKDERNRELLKETAERLEQQARKLAEELDGSG